MPPRTTKTATAVTTEEQIQVQDTAEAAETTAPKRYIKVFTTPTGGP
ncbi:hypothetical protein [Acinetobacter baumannii]|nr:hypothetical protein [Acinetobacter baumannii]EYS40464.1 hypothetical protein J970_1694 [Acinetobacter baumannii 26016_4]